MTAAIVELGWQGARARGVGLGRIESEQVEFFHWVRAAGEVLAAASSALRSWLGPR